MHHASQVFRKGFHGCLDAFCLQCLESLEFPVTGRSGADRTLQLLAANKETTSKLDLLEARKGRF